MRKFILFVSMGLCAACSWAGVKVELKGFDNDSVQVRWYNPVSRARIAQDSLVVANNGKFVLADVKEPALILLLPRQYAGRDAAQLYVAPGEKFDVKLTKGADGMDVVTKGSKLQAMIDEVSAQREVLAKQINGDKAWGEGDRDFIQDVFKQSANKDNFVDEVLEPLFRDINTDRAGYLVTSPKVNFGQQIKVPYLNGGLFEEDAYDRADFRIPAKYFWKEYNMCMDKDPRASYHFFMADAKGNYAIVEYVDSDIKVNPSKMEVLTGADTLRYVTNFYVSPTMKNTPYGSIARSRQNKTK